MIKTQKAKQRSVEENKYYWSQVVGRIAAWNMGNDSDSAHDWIKLTFGIKSTATLTTIEFEDLMQNVRDHALKYWKLEIPLPQ